MLASLKEKTLALKVVSTNNTTDSKSQPFYSLVKKPLKTFQEKTEEFLTNHPDQLFDLESTGSLEDKKKQKYKERRWSGHSYGVNLITHAAYLFQAYHFSYGVEGKPIRPSKHTLADEIGISVRTLDKALKILEDMEMVSWKSGKQTWETNIYYLADAYKTTPMLKPQDFKHPRHLWLKQQYLIKKQKLKEFTRTLYEHLLGDIADHLLCRNKKIRTSHERGGENFIKPSKDPPKTYKRPPSWHILRDLKLNFKDQWILSRYSEHLLRAAIDDLHAYQSWDKTVGNIAAFLMSRCKEHEEKRDARKQEEKPIDIKKWLISYFKSTRKRFVFVSDINQIDQATNDPRPFIQLLWHKQDIQKSVLKIYQKVQGSWIDKVFNFDRPNLAEAIESYLENLI